MCLSRRVDLALAMHRDIHPHPSHGQKQGQTMERAISYQQPQQQEYHPLPQTPFTSLLLYLQYFREKTKLGAPCALPQLASSIQGSKAAGMPQEDGNSTAGRPWEAAPHLLSRESKLFCLWDSSSFSRPCLGSGLFRGAAFSCIGVALQGDTCQPPRERGKGVWSCKSVPFNPSLHRDIRICRSRTARIFLPFLKSRGDKKK